MSTSKRGAPKAYHHGDLKAALLQAAAALLDEGGEAAVSVREVARRTGVTPTATYRHFENKEAMLAALATQGFDAFTQAMQEASTGAPQPFTAMGIAYVRFAADHPNMFRLMFGPAVADRSRSPELVAAIARATSVFDQGMQSRSDVTADARVAALRAWSLVHGLATLVLDGMLPGQDPEVLARAVLDSKGVVKRNPGAR
ncbi:TetR/AcrR family transcriptional regulator [Hydrogenophaga sp. RWCD_12]|uniref:TetR/AcrR family transcriptional regulator n=1 Tax=Hydrogenophaga sp. RWCD_12 TaxID=3391190 RepID=UPI003984A19C